jgi:hypothetical protein
MTDLEKIEVAKRFMDGHKYKNEDWVVRNTHFLDVDSKEDYLEVYNNLAQGVCGEVSECEYDNDNSIIGGAVEISKYQSYNGQTIVFTW